MVLQQSLRQRRKVETYQRLLEAGQRVMARKGYARATVDEIARDAGCTKGAFYFHFASKEDMFMALLEKRYQEQQEMLSVTFASLEPPHRAVQESLEAVFTHSSRNPDWNLLYLEFWLYAARHEKARQRLAQAYEMWRSFLGQILERGQKEGVINPRIDPAIAASALMGLVSGINLQSRMDRQAVPMPAILEPLSRIFAYGIANPERYWGREQA